MWNTFECLSYQKKLFQSSWNKNDTNEFMYKILAPIYYVVVNSNRIHIINYSLNNGWTGKVAMLIWLTILCITITDCWLATPFHYSPDKFIHNDFASDDEFPRNYLCVRQRLRSRRSQRVHSHSYRWNHVRIFREYYEW